DFPFYRAPEEFFSSVTQNLPVLLLTSLFSPASAGFYNIGRTVLALPSRLIGQSSGDVFYPRINQVSIKDVKVSRLIINENLFLSIIRLILYGALILFGLFLCAFVYGVGCEAAG